MSPIASAVSEVGCVIFSVPGLTRISLVARPEREITHSLMMFLSEASGTGWRPSLSKGPSTKTILELHLFALEFQGHLRAWVAIFSYSKWLLHATIWPIA